jgi:outer membrane protein OmpA-like peptidoglycan-associated protein
MRGWAILLLSSIFCPATAAAQEMSVDDMIRSIQRSVGSEAATPETRPTSDRTFIKENGVDDSKDGRRPIAMDNTAPPAPAAQPTRPPQPAAPALPVASNLPPSPTRCQVALAFSMILFDLGSARVAQDEQTQKTLQALTAALTSPQNANVRFFVRGHTDSTGTQQANMRLSQARAEAVAQRLITGGVRPDRVLARGMGSMEPIDADTASFKNRRVDICTFASG